MSSLAAILSSRVKAEMFRLLFSASAQELHLRELERRSGLAVGTVRQELKNLKALGLIREKAVRNRTVYSANPAHPIYAEICGIVAKTCEPEVVSAVKAEVSSEPTIEAANEPSSDWLPVTLL
jgi:Fe2+ or Zn2+ uptake regulation protein